MDKYLFACGLLLAIVWNLEGWYPTWVSCEVLFKFFKATSEWWENSTPSGLIVVTQPKKVTGPHYDPVAFVDAF
jgi:hypothetical protein